MEETDATLTARLNDALSEASFLREENKILRGALAEAGAFCVKRLPHDMREQNASSEYFQARFMTTARENSTPSPLES